MILLSDIDELISEARKPMPFSDFIRTQGLEMRAKARFSLQGFQREQKRSSPSSAKQTMRNFNKSGAQLLFAKRELPVSIPRLSHGATRKAARIRPGAAHPPSFPKEAAPISAA